MSRPLWRVRACPMETGAALSEAIQTMGPVADTLELDRRTWLTHYIVDDRIIAAALDVAASMESSQQARIYALRTLIWQKAPGHSIPTAMLTARAPNPTELRTWSSYTSHYYTDLGYGTGEYPWPVLGVLPREDYVERMDAVIERTNAGAASGALVNARAWVLWYTQDPELAELLKEARTRDQPESASPVRDGHDAVQRVRGVRLGRHG